MLAKSSYLSVSVVEFSKAESWLSSAGAVSKQDDREFLLVWAFLEYRDSSVQVFAKDGPGTGGSLSREGVLSEMDATTYRDCDGVP